MPFESLPNRLYNIISGLVIIVGEVARGVVFISKLGRWSPRERALKCSNRHLIWLTLLPIWPTIWHGVFSRSFNVVGLLTGLEGPSLVVMRRGEGGGAESPLLKQIGGVLFICGHVKPIYPLRFSLSSFQIFNHTGLLDRRQREVVNGRRTWRKSMRCSTGPLFKRIVGELCDDAKRWMKIWCMQLRAINVGSWKVLFPCM